MNTQTNIIDWNSPDFLLELANGIKNPLDTIIAANGNTSNEQTAQITLENSKKIAALVEEVIKKAAEKATKPKQPVIFELYRKNPQIQAMCNGAIDPKKISKTDIEWLVNVEDIVFNETQPNQLSLFALAFEVSVSERQLHRNIKKFLSLTPNKYIRILKLYKARKLIEDYTYRTISEVAYAVGFSDAHYFSNLFYKQYGSMPKDLLPV
ncbi:helix-turn-helix domain-containing protein [Sungkyunkwania multivorans]|uniref:Helix-turn-helix domain-containing protein n=1 Tax=Sungkyunkwania multivorans TaxID=1173618 RepID=A0ABW3CYR0_9FLAO